MDTLATPIPPKHTIEENVARAANLFIETLEARLTVHRAGERANKMSSDYPSCAGFPFENCPHCGGIEMRDRLAGVMEKARAYLMQSNLMQSK